MELSLIQKIIVWIVPLLFAITLHEVAHGFVANWFGDKTAKLAGRLTLNPLKHIDLIGTIIIPLVMLIFSPFIFGWAKPVPVDPRNLHHPRRDMAFVALAGPMANLIMAVIWALIAKGGLLLTGSNNTWLGLPLIYMGEAGLMLNLVLGILNLIPLPPLDGGNILLSILPKRAAYYAHRIEPYSFYILVLLLFSGILSNIIYPLVTMLIGGISQWFGLP